MQRTLGIVSPQEGRYPWNTMWRKAAHRVRNTYTGMLDEWTISFYCVRSLKFGGWFVTVASIILNNTENICPFFWLLTIMTPFYLEGVAFHGTLDKWIRSFSCKSVGILLSLWQSDTFPLKTPKVGVTWRYIAVSKPFTVVVWPWESRGSASMAWQQCFLGQCSKQTILVAWPWLCFPTSRFTYFLTFLQTSWQFLPCNS